MHLNLIVFWRLALDNGPCSAEEVEARIPLLLPSCSSLAEVFPSSRAKVAAASLLIATAAAFAFVLVALIFLSADVRASRGCVGGINIVVLEEVAIGRGCGAGGSDTAVLSICIESSGCSPAIAVSSSSLVEADGTGAASLEMLAEGSEADITDTADGPASPTIAFAMNMELELDFPPSERVYVPFGGKEKGATFRTVQNIDSGPKVNLNPRL